MISLFNPLTKNLYFDFPDLHKDAEMKAAQDRRDTCTWCCYEPGIAILSQRKVSRQGEPVKHVVALSFLPLGGRTTWLPLPEQRIATKIDVKTTRQ